MKSASSKDTPVRSLVTPVYQTSVFDFQTIDEMVAAFNGSSDAYIYSRIANPTIVAVEHTLAGLENSAGAILFASGLAASFAVFSSLLSPGDRVVVGRDLYGGTAVQLKELLQPWNVDVVFAELAGDSKKELEKACTEKTKLIFFETPSNPTLKITDIRSVTDFAKSRRIITVVDNTFATPVNQQPLNLGADLVVHSATKYLGGHDDITAGVVMANDGELLQKIRRYRTYAGASSDPNTAFLLKRGLRTLTVRMTAHNRNAQSLAGFLVDHPQVRNVHYPGLETSAENAKAGRQMTGYGGMLSFEINGDRKKLDRFLAGLTFVRLVPSLGGVETTILIPAFSSHFFLSAPERQSMGISDGLVRVSVGIEPESLILEEFRRALQATAD